MNTDEVQKDPLIKLRETINEDLSCEHLDKKISDFLEEDCISKYLKYKVPYLCHEIWNNLPKDSLVRYRCMIQDHLDREFYLGLYEVVDEATGNSEMQSGRYSDLTRSCPGKKVMLESSKNRLMNREVYYCVPIPGENNWVKQIVNLKNSVLGNSYNSGNRTTGQQCSDDVTMKVNPAEKRPYEDVEVEEISTSCKKLELEKFHLNSECLGAGNDLNFPLPGEDGVPCLLKVYGNEDSQLPINQMIEVVGILSCDPALGNLNLNDNDDDLDEAIQVRSPPGSLIPRIHALKIRKLPHNHPSLPLSVDQTSNVELIGNVAVLRENILGHLKMLLWGDTLAAEYLLIHLISSVYGRQDVAILGNFSLNFTSIPTDEVRRLVEFVKNVTLKTFLLPLTVQNLNEMKFVPTKDYTRNRLTSGCLQLAERTHMIVDETVMEPGQLDVKGVSNLTSLGNMIKWQKVDYDFEFHQREFHCNNPVLVLSEAKSVVECDCLLPIEVRKNWEVVSMEDEVEKIRCYFALLPFLSNEMEQGVGQIIEEDFVSMRKENPSGFSVDDFHLLLIIARLISQTFGSLKLKVEHWKRARQLEKLRRLRFSTKVAGGAAA